MIVLGLDYIRVVVPSSRTVEVSTFLHPPETRVVISSFLIPGISGNAGPGVNSPVVAVANPTAPMPCPFIIPARPIEPGSHRVLHTPQYQGIKSFKRPDINSRRNSEQVIYSLNVFSCKVNVLFLAATYVRVRRW